MDWSINLPYRDRDDLVLEAIRAARDSQLPEEEVQVVDVLARDALERGITTVGGLLDELEQLDRDGARRRLDWAREKAGLVSATESDKRREQRRIDARFSDHDIPPPPRWEGEWQQCHAPNCNAFPANEAGALAKVTCERWFCRAHEPLAEEGDLEDHQPAYVGFEFGRLVPSEREKARIAAEIRKRDEPLERERQQREEHDRREHEALTEVEERYDREAWLSVGGIQVHPRNLRVNYP